MVAKFLDYKIVESNTIGSQGQELQLILHDLIAEDMVVNEAFQVAAMIEKLPPSWNDFKNYLKHKRKEMKLEDLVIPLNIEEDNRNAEKKSRKSSTIIGGYIVEEGPTKDKRERSPTGRSQNRPRRNSKATVIIVARLVIDLLIVLLQERTKTKAKAKIKQTSWKKWKMQMTCVQ